MPKFFVLFFLFLLSTSCSNSVDEKLDDELTLLQNGTWKLEDSKKPLLKFQIGLKFSTNNKLFYVDSQGHTIPTHNEIHYSLSNDTLRFIDHKYLKTVRYKKGTSLFLIEKLSKDSLVLQLVHPTDNKIVYVNQE